MTSFRPFLISLVVCAAISVGHYRYAHGQVLTGAGRQCRSNIQTCQFHLDALVQGRRNGLLVRYSLSLPNTDGATDGATGIRQDGTSSSHSGVSDMLRGLTFIHRFTLWRRSWGGWSIAAHSLTGIRDAITAATRGQPTVMRAGMAIEWELARHGRDGRPYFTAVIGVGMQMALAGGRDLPGTLRELRDAAEFSVHPSASIRIAPAALLREIW